MYQLVQEPIQCDHNSHNVDEVKKNYFSACASRAYFDAWLCRSLTGMIFQEIHLTRCMFLSL